MKKTLLAAAAATVALSAPAFAWEGKKVACYDKVWQDPVYQYTQELEYPAKMKWEHVNGQMVEMHYAPIYMQKKTMVRGGRYVLVKAACK